MRGTLIFGLSLAMALTSAALGDGSTNGAAPVWQSQTSHEEASTMKIRLEIRDQVIMATLIDSATTRDFVLLLPLTLTMNDLFGREKFGHLPRAISEGGERRRTYEVGQAIYWSPGPEVAIFYRHDGQPVPSPGIIAMGKMDAGVETLNVPGSVEVTIELAGIHERNE